MKPGETCKTCNGTGQVPVKKGDQVVSHQPCPRCGGKGVIRGDYRTK
jgi:DnaJ-class molecular chaperone